MAGARDDDEEVPVGELFGRLIDEGKAYARAEGQLARARVEVEIGRVKRPAILGAIALALAFAGVIAFILTLVLWLGSLLGWLGGGLVATVLAFAAAGLLAVLAKRSWERGR